MSGAIFSFGEEAYIWAWWLVGGWEKDLLMCLYRPNPGAELTLTYRFRYYASEDPHEARDEKHTYHATWPKDFDPEKAIEVARTVCKRTAEAYAAEWCEIAPTAFAREIIARVKQGMTFADSLIDELTVGGGPRQAFDVLLKHEAAHPVTTAKGGIA